MKKEFVFTTLRKQNDVLEYFDLHQERITNSLTERFDIGCKLDFQKIYDECLLLDDGVIKITTDGEDYVLGHRALAYTTKMYKMGFNVCLSGYTSHSTNRDVYFKGVMSDTYVKLLNDVRADGYDEALIQNENGYITEGLITNVFFVNGENVYTPEVRLGLLDGIMRNVVIEKLIGAGYNVFETKISVLELENFRGAFLTNCVLGVMPISKIGAIKFDVLEVEKLQFNTKKDINKV